MLNTTSASRILPKECDDMILLVWRAGRQAPVTRLQSIQNIELDILKVKKFC